MLVKEKFYNYNEEKFIFHISFVFFFCTEVFASQKKNIINNLNKIKNITFDFEQTIDEKKEKGNCVIKYPKLINCSYDGAKGKKMISNGNSLVIKITNSDISYIYPLESTPLNYILDKNYIISEIKKLEPKFIENKYIYFTMLNENQKINIFFDSKDFHIIGWQTEDIYQNLVITFISKIKINQKIDDKLFKLPKLN